MLTKITDKFIEKTDTIKLILSTKQPTDYEELLRIAISAIYDEYDLDWKTPLPDPERITKINNGSYNGTLLFVICAGAYENSKFYYTSVYYGSCSVCDAFERIRNYDDENPNEEQINDYFTLMLHMMQRMKLIDADADEKEDE